MRACVPGMRQAACASHKPACVSAPPASCIAAASGFARRGASGAGASASPLMHRCIAATVPPIWAWHRSCDVKTGQRARAAAQVRACGRERPLHVLFAVWKAHESLLLDGERSAHHALHIVRAVHAQHVLQPRQRRGQQVQAPGQRRVRCARAALSAAHKLARDALPLIPRCAPSSCSRVVRYLCIGKRCPSGSGTSAQSAYRHGTGVNSAGEGTALLPHRAASHRRCGRPGGAAGAAARYMALRSSAQQRCCAARAAIATPQAQPQRRCGAASASAVRALSFVFRHHA